MQNRKLLNIELGRVSADEYKELPDTGVVIVLDNIRSAHNVGSAFRTSDSFKVDKVWLCGICAQPPSAEIHKSALGAEFSVPWEYSKTTDEAIRILKEQGYVIVSVEQTAGSVMLDGFVPEKGVRYALVFGNYGFMGNYIILGYVRMWWMPRICVWKSRSTGQSTP